MILNKKKTIIIMLLMLITIALFITLGIVFFNLCNKNMLETMELFKNDNMAYKNSLSITSTFGILSIIMYSFASFSVIALIILIIKRFIETF